MMSISVRHILGDQLSHGEFYRKLVDCVLSHKNFENVMQKFDLEKKLSTILVFCLYERNRRLLLDSTGDSATQR